MKSIVVLSLLLMACGGAVRPVFSKIPGQDEAQSIAWKFYGADKELQPPPVEWSIYNRDTDTYSSPCPHYSDYPSICISGVFDDTTEIANVAISASGTPVAMEVISGTAYAHELYHAFRFYTTGDADSAHMSAGFQKGGAVAQANALLAAQGM